MRSASRCSRKAWAGLRPVPSASRTSASDAEPAVSIKRDDRALDLGDELGLRVELAADPDCAAVGAQRGQRPRVGVVE